jgi:hypothetical protein
MARKTRKPAAAAVSAAPLAAFEIRTTASGRSYAKVTVGNWSANLTGEHLRILLANRDACDALMASDAAPAPAPMPPIGNTHAAPPAKSPVTPELLARAKAAHVKAAHLYRDGAKLQAAIDAKAPATPKAAAPAPAPAPAVTLAKPTMSSPAPLRVEQHPTLLMTALGADNNMYALMSDGTFRLISAAQNVA